MRHTLLALAHRHRLNRSQTQALLQEAGLSQEPDGVAVWLPRGVAVLAAALLGLGLVMWIAANWDTMGRAGHFVLLQGLVALSAVGAACIPKVRAPLGLLALLGIGGLFAYFGQTYQTGADPWQLFALWAALALPLCVGARSDVLWVPWTVVVLTAVALWTHTYGGHRWRVDPDLLTVHLLAWTATLVVVAALSSRWAHFTGAGVWGFRTACTLSVIAITLTAVGGLFHETLAGQYPAGLLVLGLGAAWLARPKHFDIVALSALALGVNALLVSGLVRYLSEGAGSDWIARFMVVGLFAAGLLAASVSGILTLSKRRAPRTEGTSV
ncbi:DUF2157 domain-containing protein [Rhodoferax aquaticus]|uniref:DUF2157 domain-containing protein n=1 Tax=Rhodoferax aquaticus TaxID=2527691 RepID=A0A515ES40_9BURK|nr:DUF2157 domain-containing protein [Rhodoferax aquaticus]QDL55475.1 DUF2157 domain-containing protein [Rhodoferax aquaticus]